MRDIAYRVIADHVRCLTFALTDGGIPDRDGRGYVLRRILRRAVRYGWQYLNTHEPFLYKLVPTVVDTMGDAFPELRKNPQHVIDLIREEEESFQRTLATGIELFEQWATLVERVASGDYVTEPNLDDPPDPRKVASGKWIHPKEVKQFQEAGEYVLSGAAAFRLHDTYGFPIDLTEIMAAERGLRVDIGEYERLMKEAREQARKTAQGVTMIMTHFGKVFDDVVHTDDVPKYKNEALGTSIVAVAVFDRDTAFQRVDVLSADEVGAIVLERTPFYAEAGGQVHDQGHLETPTGRFVVEEVLKVANRVVHYGHVQEGVIQVGSSVQAQVNPERRATMKNHTATHVMNWALREVLDPEGKHLQQKGSLVDPEKTRFDFSHSKPLTPEEIERIEQLVNERIQQKLPIYDSPVSQEDAFKVRGLRAVFGEKYPEEVRVLSVGTPVDELLANPDNPAWQDISIELCGGTHVKNTSEISCFAITHEEAVAKGVRRLVGVTGDAARNVLQNGINLLERADALRRAGSTRRDDETDFATQLSELQRTVDETTLRVVDRIKLREAIGELQQIVKQQQKDQAAEALDVVNARIKELLESAPKIGSTTIVVAEMPEVPIEQLKQGADTIKQKCGSAAILFGTSAGGKAMLLAAMSSDLIKKGLKAGDLVKHVAPIVKGGGGGPPTMAQAGGKDPEKLPDALQAGRAWIEERLP